MRSPRILASRAVLSRAFERRQSALRNACNGWLELWPNIWPLLFMVVVMTVGLKLYRKTLD